jgi:transcriptional enhancer factor
MNQAAFFVEVSSSSDRETLINVPFPAAQFADVFAHLVGMQGQYEDQTKSQTCSRGSDPLDRPAREYVEQLSMYQELQSEGEPGASFVTRAVFIWTFHEARKGESNHTTWGYLDLAPPRRAIMSPPPHPRHQVSATINENYCCWAETPLLMQPTSVVDPPCRQGLATPPHTADFQSPFPANEYSFLQQTFEMPDENLSFISNMTLESGSTLVDVTTADIESFMSNAHSQLTDFEHSASNWQFTACEGFEPDPDWATYGIPSHAPIVAWETETKLKGWPELELQDVKQLDWMDDTNSKHQHEWESNQMKQIINLTEQNVGQKPMAWMNEHHNSLEEDIKVDFEPVVNLRTGMNIALHRNEAPNLSVESMDSYKKEADWHSTVDDVFHYAQLTKLKA